jgi:methylated-DNA-[protein]-cysteine S-methyltransferase
MKLHQGKLASPLGELLIVSDVEGRVRALDYADHRTRLIRLLQKHYGDSTLVAGALSPAIHSALTRYFAGELAALDEVVTATNGSELEHRVWQALRRIPAGRTTSYGELARTLGFSDPRAAMDVGAANQSNPIAIIVPCHRVIAKNGDLKGYAGGPHRKRWLLQHEGALTKGRVPMEPLRLPGL